MIHDSQTVITLSDYRPPKTELDNGHIFFYVTGFDKVKTRACLGKG